MQNTETNKQKNHWGKILLLTFRHLSLKRINTETGTPQNERTLMITLYHEKPIKKM